MITRARTPVSEWDSGRPALRLGDTERTWLRLPNNSTVLSGPSSIANTTPLVPPPPLTLTHTCVTGPVFLCYAVRT